MHIKYLKDKAVVELKKNIKNNLERYRVGDFDYLQNDVSQYFEGSLEINKSILQKIQIPDGTALYDVDNSMIILNALPNMSPYHASDERIWSMLSHTVLLEYGRKRWPIPKKNEEAISYINTHYFAGTQRQLERDNLVSRLWWMGYLCSRVKDMDLNLALDVLMYKTDVRANIIERPTTSQSVNVFSAILARLVESYKGNKKLFERETFRMIMVKLNLLGGYKLLEAMDKKKIESSINSILNELQIEEV